MSSVFRKRKEIGINCSKLCMTYAGCSTAADLQQLSDMQTNFRQGSSSLALLPDKEKDNGKRMDIHIRNVVCSFGLPLHVNLRSVALSVGNVILDRRKGCATKQKRNPPCYVNIYSSGKVNVIGCHSAAECYTAARGVGRLIQRAMGKLDKRISIRNYRICNLMATVKLPFGIKIENVALKYSEYKYEPELSVGLIYRSKIPKGTLQIHTTGTVTVTGATNETDVLVILNRVYDQLREFRCDRSQTEVKSKKRLYADEFGREHIAKRRMEDSTAISALRHSVSPLAGGAIYHSDEDDFYDD